MRLPRFRGLPRSAFSDRARLFWDVLRESPHNPTKCRGSAVCRSLRFQTAAFNKNNGLRGFWQNVCRGLKGTKKRAEARLPQSVFVNFLRKFTHNCGTVNTRGQNEWRKTPHSI